MWTFNQCINITLEEFKIDYLLVDKKSIMKTIYNMIYSKLMGSVVFVSDSQNFSIKNIDLSFSEIEWVSKIFFIVFFRLKIMLFRWPTISPL